MKVVADFSECGAERMFYAGSVAYDTTDVDSGVIICKAPQKMIITRAVCVVGHAFDAGTTNVLILGTEDDDDAIMAAGDITEGTAAAYTKQIFMEVEKGAEIVAKYTQSGTAATAGDAEFYLFGVSIP